VEIPVTQYLIEGDIAASVKSWKTTHEHGVSDAGSNSENNTDDSFELAVPRLDKMIENIVT
jgi:hypothetical protein